MHNRVPVPPGRPRRFSFRLVLLAMSIMGGGIETSMADDAKFDEQRAFGYLQRICRIGPRITGSPGMSQQQALLAEHFKGLKAEVRLQSFDAPHPLGGGPVRMGNLIVSWHPDAKQRVLLACHYDTRPYPDREVNPFRRRDIFLGANDGASGVALLMELGNQMHTLKPTYGVDFVFFDAEEFVFARGDKYFLGSEHFAKEYRDKPPEYRYVYGILLDMVADQNLQLYKERNSVRYAPELTDSIWAAAARAGVTEFVDRIKHEVEDDHIPLNRIAKIPTCDIIDFDFPYWHTRKDTPEVCSGESLGKVAKVLKMWLENAPGVPGN